MNHKFSVLVAGLLASVCAAHAVTFSPGSINPTFLSGGISKTYTASTISNSSVGTRYKLDLASNPGYHMSGPTGSITWDFYVQATPGMVIHQIRFAFDGGNPGLPNVNWSATTQAAYFNGTGYTSVSPINVGPSEVGAPQVQVANLPGLHNRWHITFTGSWNYLPHGLDIFGGYAQVTEAVPEPGTFAALGLGGLALLARRRRRA